MIEEAPLKDKIYALAALLEIARDNTHIPFTASAVEVSQKRERARQEADELKQELEAEGLTINIDDPRQIEIMDEFFLLYTYLAPGVWIDHFKESKTS